MPRETDLGVYAKKKQLRAVYAAPWGLEAYEHEVRHNLYPSLPTFDFETRQAFGAGVSLVVLSLCRREFKRESTCRRIRQTDARQTIRSHSRPYTRVIRPSASGPSPTAREMPRGSRGRSRWRPSIDRQPAPYLAQPTTLVPRDRRPIVMKPSPRCEKLPHVRVQVARMVRHTKQWTHWRANLTLAAQDVAAYHRRGRHLSQSSPRRRRASRARGWLY